MSRLCAHPGCNATLYSGNRSGVCRAHNHLEGCGCVQCGGKPKPARVKVTVPLYPSSSTPDPRTRSVTLPRAPWEASA